MSLNATFCPHCGEDAPESNESFCGECGASLSALMPDTACSNCAEPIQDTDIYCRHCRYFVSMNC